MATGALLHLSCRSHTKAGNLNKHQKITIYYYLSIAPGKTNRIHSVAPPAHCIFDIIDKTGGNAGYSLLRTTRKHSSFCLRSMTSALSLHKHLGDWWIYCFHATWENCTLRRGGASARNIPTGRLMLPTVLRNICRAQAVPRFVRLRQYIACMDYFITFNPVYCLFYF